MLVRRNKIVKNNKEHVFHVRWSNGYVRIPNGNDNAEFETKVFGNVTFCLC